MLTSVLVAAKSSQLDINHNQQTKVTATATAIATPINTASHSNGYNHSHRNIKGYIWQSARAILWQLELSFLP